MVGGGALVRRDRECAFLEDALAGLAGSGGGVVLAGGTHKVRFRGAQDFANRYGGSASDWVKKSTTDAVRSTNGYTYQIHWVENVRTGQIVDPKLTDNAPR
jgi:hypothetical protein